jgi:hypothetical protein
MAPITAPTNSFCGSGLAENRASVLFLRLRLLLQGLAFFEPVFDVGDDVAHAGVGVITGEQVVDLLDNLGQRQAYSSTSSDPATAQALWRLNPPANTEHRGRGRTRKTVSSVRFWILTLLPRLWLRAQVTELQFQPV